MAEKQAKAPSPKPGEMKVDLAQLRELVDLMERHELLEVELQEHDSRIKLRRAGPEETRGAITTFLPAVPAAPAAAPGATAPAVPPAAPPPPPAPALETEDVPVASPTVGTFYRSPAPDAPPFVEVGDEVTAETVVCIIEAMKVMNEVRAERPGVVKAILVENAQPVEYGQPLIIIGPAAAS